MPRLGGRGREEEAFNGRERGDNFKLYINIPMSILNIMIISFFDVQKRKYVDINYSFQLLLN